VLFWTTLTFTVWIKTLLSGSTSFLFGKTMRLFCRITVKHTHTEKYALIKVPCRAHKAAGSDFWCL